MSLTDIFKQAREMQARAQEVQAQLAAIEVEGVSGAGLVRVTLNGKSDLRRIAIDPTLLKPEEGVTVQDLIVAAHADAKSKLERRIADEMQRLAASLGLSPGLGLGG